MCHFCLRGGGIAMCPICDNVHIDCLLYPGVRKACGSLIINKKNIYMILCPYIYFYYLFSTRERPLPRFIKQE